jgi:hypothetical protein
LFQYSISGILLLEERRATSTEGATGESFPMKGTGGEALAALWRTLARAAPHLTRMTSFLRRRISMSPDHQIDLHGVRLFALAWLGVYPMMTLVSWLFGDVLLLLPLPIRTFILSGLMVGYTVVFWMPFIQRFNPARERVGGNVSIKP